MTSSHVQVSRLGRELERLEEDKSRAREETKRSEAARLAAEGELKDLKRQAGQQLREAHASGSEAARAAAEERAAAERRERAAAEEVARAHASMEAAGAAAASLTARVAQLEAAARGLEADVEGHRAAAAAAAGELAALKDELCDARARHACAAADSARLTLELSTTRDARAAAEGDGRAALARLDLAQKALTEARQSQEARPLGFWAPFVLGRARPLAAAAAAAALLQPRCRPSSLSSRALLPAAAAWAHAARRTLTHAARPSPPFPSTSPLSPQPAVRAHRVGGRARRAARERAQGRGGGGGAQRGARVAAGLPGVHLGGARLGGGPPRGAHA